MFLKTNLVLVFAQFRGANVEFKLAKTNDSQPLEKSVWTPYFLQFGTTFREPMTKQARKGAVISLQSPCKFWLHRDDQPRDRRVTGK